MYITACTVVQYKRLYKPWALSMGEGDFRPPQPETPRPIFMKLEIYNYFPDTTPHAKFQVPTSTWVVWANSQFDAWKFLSYFPFLVTHSRPQDTSQRSIRHYASFQQKKCLLGVRKIKFEIWPPLRPKNVKIGTLSWRSMENCSHPNSGTVSPILFKLGTGIDHTSGIAWHDSKVKRSKVKVTRAHNVYS